MSRVNGEEGDKEDLAGMAKRVAAENKVVVALPNYRLSQKENLKHHPVFIEDCAAALHWLFDNSLLFDKEKVYLGGHSVGAQLSALLHWQGSTWLRPEVAKSIYAWIGVSGMVPGAAFITLNFLTLQGFTTFQS
jgi:acetyl esterase/lipase